MMLLTMRCQIMLQQCIRPKRAGLIGGILTFVVIGQEGDDVSFFHVGADALEGIL